MGGCVRTFSGGRFRHYGRFVPTQCVRAMEVGGVKRVGRNSEAYCADPVRMNWRNTLRYSALRTVLAAVARMERSAIRDRDAANRAPDFASLHPGYPCCLERESPQIVFGPIAIGPACICC